MIQPYTTEKKTKLILYSTLKTVKSSVIWGKKTERENTPECTYDKMALRM